MHGMDNLKTILTWSDFHEIWYGSHIISGHANLLLFPTVVNHAVAGVWAWKLGATIVGHLFKVTF
jgi:hypothetical protein